MTLALRPARSRREPRAPAPLGTLRFPGALAWPRAPPLPQLKPGPGRGGAAASRRWVPVPAVHRLRARARRGTALAPAPAYGPSPSFSTVARGSRGRQGDPQDRAPRRPRRPAGQSSPMAGECPRLPALDPSAAPGPFGHSPPHRRLALGHRPCPTPGSEPGVLENEAGSSQTAAGQEVWRSPLLTTPPPGSRAQNPEPGTRKSRARMLPKGGPFFAQPGQRVGAWDSASDHSQTAPDEGSQVAANVGLRCQQQRVPGSPCLILAAPILVHYLSSSSHRLPTPITGLTLLKP